MIYLMNNNEFQKLLYSMIHENNVSLENICLISHEPLEDNSIELECGHKFNYSSIYESVYKEKKGKVNRFEKDKLSCWQIRCPYCRHIQNKLLPPHNDYKNVLYVNYPTKYCMKTNTCIHTYKIGERRGTLCNEICAVNETYCKKHSKSSNEKVKKGGCKFILTRGKRKGEMCDCNVYKEEMCKRHYYSV